MPADLPRDRYRSIRRVAFLISERKFGCSETEEMSFQELSIRLNYNDPSAAQKVYDRAQSKSCMSACVSELGVWLHANAVLRETLRKIESGGAVTRREPC